jgi:hypothetical protein
VKAVNAIVGNCRKCDYPLVRLTEMRCPECGTPFDPDNPTTMNFHFSPVVAFLEKPITFWTVFPGLLIWGGIGSLIVLMPSNEMVWLGSLLMMIPVLGTFYVVYARLRFQAFKRRRAARRGAGASGAP